MPSPSRTHPLPDPSSPQGVFKIKNLVAQTEVTVSSQGLEEEVLKSLAALPKRRAIFTYNSVNKATADVESKLKVNA